VFAVPSVQLTATPPGPSANSVNVLVAIHVKQLPPGGGRVPGIQARRRRAADPAAYREDAGSAHFDHRAILMSAVGGPAIPS
jgi:hypothetical protein